MEAETKAALRLPLINSPHLLAAEGNNQIT